MGNTTITEAPTGRYCFKKKWGGMVIYVEIREITECHAHFSLNPEPVEVTYWRKATEEDLVSIKIFTKK